MRNNSAKLPIRSLSAIAIAIALAFGALGFVACGDEGGGVYCCTYESRHTGCGGSGWTEWETSSEQFNIDDYKEGWSPEDVCDKYTGTWDECGGSCCISGEYRNNVLSSGACP